MRSVLLSMLVACSPLMSQDALAVALFDGTTLAGWEGNTTSLWRVEQGAIVAGRPGVKQPETEFLCSTKEYGNFDLTVDYNNHRMNGGIQFRSQRIPQSTEMIGYQADFFKGGDGSLWDESRRRKMLGVPDAATAATLNLTTWNVYRIRAVGPHIQLWVNGVRTVDYHETDPSIPQRGYLGLQLHKNAEEIRYRNVRITELPQDATP